MYIYIVLTSADIPDKNIMLVTPIIVYNLKKKVASNNPIQPGRVSDTTKKLKCSRYRPGCGSEGG